MAYLPLQKKHSPPPGGLCFFAGMGKDPVRCSPDYETGERKPEAVFGHRNPGRSDNPELA